MAKMNNNKRQREPRSLEPLLQDPNYLKNLASTMSRTRRGGTELDPVIPRIIKDLLNPMTKVDMGKYGKFLLEEPVYTNLVNSLYFLWNINYQQDMALTNYLVCCGIPVQAPMVMADNIPQNMVYNNQLPYYDIAGFQPEYGMQINATQATPQEIYSINTGVTTPVQQNINPPACTSPYVNTDTMYELLCTVRANEIVYKGARDALIAMKQILDYYGVLDGTSIDMFITYNSDKWRYIQFPDMEGMTYIDKRESMERHNNNRRERRNNDTRRR